MTYCSEIAADPGNAPFAAGASLLLHEAWYAEASTADQTRSADGEAATIARDAGVDRLVIIHVNPLERSDEGAPRPCGR